MTFAELPRKSLHCGSVSQGNGGDVEVWSLEWVIRWLFFWLEMLKLIHILGKKRIFRWLDRDQLTIGVEKVRSFGLEGRTFCDRGQHQVGREVPASNEIYDCIVFRGKDLKDLRVLQGLLEHERQNNVSARPPATAGYGRSPGVGSWNVGVTLCGRCVGSKVIESIFKGRTFSILILTCFLVHVPFMVCVADIPFAAWKAATSIDQGQVQDPCPVEHVPSVPKAPTNPTPQRQSAQNTVEKAIQVDTGAYFEVQETRSRSEPGSSKKPVLRKATNLPERCDKTTQVELEREAEIAEREASTVQPAGLRGENQQLRFEVSRLQKACQMASLNALKKNGCGLNGSPEAPNALKNKGCGLNGFPEAPGSLCETF
eukprot:s2017_g4.t1